MHAFVLSRFGCVRLFVTMDCSPPGFSVHGILKARILEWVVSPSSRGTFPTRGSNLCLLYLLHCRWILYCWATRELRCWRRLSRVPWTAKRSNQPVLKEINPKYSLEGLVLKLQYFAKTQLIRKDSDTGKDWRQEEKGMTEDKMVGWHHWLNGHKFEQAPGDGEGQGSLACCSPWGRRGSNRSEWLNTSRDPPPTSGQFRPECNAGRIGAWKTAAPNTLWWDLSPPIPQGEESSVAKYYECPIYTDRRRGPVPSLDLTSLLVTEVISRGERPQPPPPQQGTHAPEIENGHCGRNLAYAPLSENMQKRSTREDH